MTIGVWTGEQAFSLIACYKKSKKLVRYPDHLKILCVTQDPAGNVIQNPMRNGLFNLHIFCRQSYSKFTPGTTKFYRSEFR